MMITKLIFFNKFLTVVITHRVWFKAKICSFCVQRVNLQQCLTSVHSHVNKSAFAQRQYLLQKRDEPLLVMQQMIITAFINDRYPESFMIDPCFYHQVD